MAFINQLPEALSQRPAYPRLLVITEPVALQLVRPDIAPPAVLRALIRAEGAHSTFGALEQLAAVQLGILVALDTARVGLGQGPPRIGPVNGHHGHESPRRR